MFGNREFEEYEAIQREEALKKIESLVKRYGFDRTELLSVLPAPIEQNKLHGEHPVARKFDPFFDAW